MSFKNSLAKIEKEEATKVLGENSHPSLSMEGLGDNLVGLFFGLVRGKNEKVLREEVEKILEGRKNEEIQNLFLVAFQTRWCRGGKGEKKLFYIIFSILYDKYPEVCHELLPLIPLYGYWKDFRSLYLYYHSQNGDNFILFEKMNDILEKQLKEDIVELEKGDGVPKLSLLAKYYSPKKCYAVKKDKLDVSRGVSEKTTEKVISEKSKIEHKFFQELAIRLYNPKKSRLAPYKNYAEMTLRHRLVALRKALDIPEVKMCSNRWNEINFARVPSICLSRNTMAFLDEDKNGRIKHPENDGRQMCRHNLLDKLKEGLKGGQLNPNELVEKVYGGGVSLSVKAVVNSQWESLMKNVQEQIRGRIAETGKNNFDITKCIVMSDVSGSMVGTPMMVSIGFGILVSQLTHSSFRDLVMTFNDEPVFHNLENNKTFTDKVLSLNSAPWGGSTNFEAAMNLIIHVIEKDKLAEEELPQSLLVISNMQFNEASGMSDYESRKRGNGWGTAYDNII